MERKFQRKTDEMFMRRALKLSLRGLGRVNPNPLVGAVIVKDEKIIGQGYHEFYGGAHAEINAINNCKSSFSASLPGATLYVTLEPCSHFGKTPPCVDAIIDAGIGKVVCATSDPNPSVGGAGLKKLQDAGIAVVSGVLENEAKKINEVFFKYITTQEPFVVLKTAISLDGKIATASGDSKWITNEKSRQEVHKLRHRLSAVMVGANTVLKDDPRLSARINNGRDPIKIVIDSELNKIPCEISLGAKSTAKLFTNKAKTIIVTSKQHDKEKHSILLQMGVEVIVMPSKDGVISLKEIMKELGRRGIDSVLLEGGGTLNSFALNENIVDKIIVFIAPKLIGGKHAPTFFDGHGAETMQQAQRLELISCKRFDEDLMLEYKVDNVYRTN